MNQEEESWSVLKVFIIIYIKNIFLYHIFFTLGFIVFLVHSNFSNQEQVQ